MEYEAGRNPYPLRKAHSEQILVRAVQVIRLSDEIEKRARVFNEAGVKPLDALHLACAVQAGADYFCTCDDQLLRRSHALHAGPPKVVTPVELIGELGT